MDRVRFGRALGFGARQAVKTLVTAAGAATAANPSHSGRTPGGSAEQGVATPQARVSTDMGRPKVRPESPPARTTAAAPVRKAAHTATKTIGQAREVQKGLRRGTKRFGEAIWGPFVRLSGVLWLEVSGVFFGIFALLALGYLWQLRGAWRSGTAAAHRSLMGAVLMLALFGYFCVSSFVRARRRERRR